MNTKKIFTECYRLARVGVLEGTARQLFDPVIVRAAYHAYLQSNMPVRVTRQFQYVLMFGGPDHQKYHRNIYESNPSYADRRWIPVASKLVDDTRMNCGRFQERRMYSYYAKDIPLMTHP